MRLLTMNILGDDENWQDRRAVMTAGLVDLSPDVIAFQESVKTDTYDQVLDLVGDGFHIFHQAGRSDDGVGASVTSRWPISVLREANLHIAEDGDSPGWIGSLAIVEIDVPAPVGPVLLAHHKPAWQSGLERSRERQAVASAQIIEEEIRGKDRHVLLAGDFDAAPDAASVRFWSGRQSLEGVSVYYQDAWEAIHPEEPGHTFSPRNRLVSDEWRPRPGRRIDYVFVRCGAKGAKVNITNCELAFAEPIDSVWASDHFGVVADISPRISGAVSA